MTCVADNAASSHWPTSPDHHRTGVCGPLPCARSLHSAEAGRPRPRGSISLRIRATSPSSPISAGTYSSPSGIARATTRRQLDGACSDRLLTAGPDRLTPGTLRRRSTAAHRRCTPCLCVTGGGTRRANGDTASSERKTEAGAGGDRGTAPELVDLGKWSHHWRSGGPMPLAPTRSKWSM
jgi:hypothetical protein